MTKTPIRSPYQDSTQELMLPAMSKRDPTNKNIKAKTKENEKYKGGDIKNKGQFATRNKIVETIVYILIWTLA